jgi:hypothetical protein
MMTSLRSKWAAGKAVAGREEGTYLNRSVTDPAAAHARQHKRSRSRSRRFGGGQRKSVPQGPDESSPVRSAGLAFLKNIRLGRDDRQMLAIAEPRAKSKPSVSFVPYETDLSFCFISQHFVLGYFH